MFSQLPSLYHMSWYSAANLHLAWAPVLDRALAALLRYQVTWLNFGSASARAAQPAQVGAHSAHPSHQPCSVPFLGPAVIGCLRHLRGCVSSWTWKLYTTI